MAAGKGKSKGKTSQHKQTSRSSKAGLTFPVGRIARLLKNGRYADRIGINAPVFLAAVLEYLVSEIFEISVMHVRDNKKNRIVPRYIYLAIKEDDELNKFFSKAIITQSGVKPDAIKKKNN